MSEVNSVSSSGLGWKQLHGASGVAEFGISWFKLMACSNFMNTSASPAVRATW